MKKIFLAAAVTIIATTFGCKDTNFGCKDKNTEITQEGMPETHPAVAINPSLHVESGSIKKAEGGYTIEECFSQKDKLQNKTIKLRGKIVKVNLGIMNKNWIHLMDGTGKEGSNTLTLTSNDKAEVGKIVLISGKIFYDKEISKNHKYNVIVEDAKITVEK